MAYKLFDRRRFSLTAILGIFLVLQAVSLPSAAAATSQSTRTFIVAFKYAAIEASVQHAINSTSAKPQQSRQGRGSKPIAFPVKRYLQLTASQFETEKRGVINTFPGVTIIQDYSMLPVAAVRVTASEAAALESDPRVFSVTPVESYALAGEAQHGQASATTGPADLRVIDDIKAKASGDLGQGTSVAILDDGTNYEDPAFGTCPPFGLPGCSVLAYKDFAKPPTSGLSFTGHGTNVAGQVLKVAPQAGLVIGNVFHATSTGSQASDMAVMNGLKWVLSEAAVYQASNPIRAVNLSLGNAFTYHVSTCTSSPYAAVFSQLMGANIQPVVAAGNYAYDGGKFKNGVEEPACAPDAMAVGAVYDLNIGSKNWPDCTDGSTAPDKIACFSQGGPLVAVVAPGVNETAAGITDSGTSMATPLVSGAIAALASGAMSVPTRRIASAIIGFGKTITDNRTNETVQSLDVFAAEQNLANDWNNAIEVPGTAALNTGGNAEIASVSCTSPGDCSAGGSYTDSSGHRQAFAVSQVNGTWDSAQEVAGTAALNTGGNAEISSVSCTSPGNCTAGGDYRGRGGYEVFVVSQVNGTWGTAAEIPGITALNAGHLASVNSVSCASAGNCSAGGWYNDGSQNSQAFVVSQVNGTWGTAEEVPGTAALNTGGVALVRSVSCTSPGNCSAAGFYTGTSGSVGFVVSQVNGAWGTAGEEPGGQTDAESVSCVSAGNCVAGGASLDGSQVQGSIISQVNGTWGSPEQVPGIAALNTGGDAYVTSVSCTSAGNCTADGWYETGTDTEPFAVSEVNGTWDTAVELTGVAIAGGGGHSIVTPVVSCVSAGQCAAGGFYEDSSSRIQAFVASQASETWKTPEEVPGTAALNTGGEAEVNSVSCSVAGGCSAGGFYTDSSGHSQAFVVS